MKAILFFITLLLSLNIYAAVPGFGENADVFKYAPIRGYLSVSCYGRDIDHAYHRCMAWHVTPSRFAYFYGPEGVEADKVKLVSTWESGKVVKKSHKYKSEKFRTKKKVNLAVRTLLQKPLLGPGKNQISYKMLKDDEVVHEGSFAVDYLEDESRTCPNGHIVSHNPRDCSSSYNVCETYFRRYNYCR